MLMDGLSLVFAALQGQVKQQCTQTGHCILVLHVFLEAVGDVLVHRSLVLPYLSRRQHSILT